MKSEIIGFSAWLRVIIGLEGDGVDGYGVRLFERERGKG